MLLRVLLISSSVCVCVCVLFISSCVFVLCVSTHILSLGYQTALKLPGPKNSLPVISSPRLCQVQSSLPRQ